MTPGGRPKQPPKGLQGAGRALWRHLVAFEPEPHEERIMLEACRVADRLDGLAAVVAVDGPIVRNRHGEQVAHPALVEARQQQLTLARLIAALAIPEAEEEVGRSAASRKAQKAAQARWGIRDAAVARGNDA